MMVDDQAKTRLSESVPDPLVGRVVDGYRIDEILGRGGMGVVYKATQQSLGRDVAIKVLPEEVLENRQFLDRFEREVDILARLSHPNIVTVFERGEIDGRPYIAMEYVRGTTLRDVMAKGPLPPSEALLLVRAVLSALEHAHGQGIIHRDIKPENVLVAPGGIVKVADFGLSRHLEGEDRTRLTKTFVALGTFEYMSPEQREMARDADARSDLYATGVVLYEMIAGELPIGAFEPLSAKRPRECDTRIDQLVERALKKSPDSRWDDAESMGAAVSQLLSSAGLAEPPPIPDPMLQEQQPMSEEPKWKRMLSNVFGREFPIARREGRFFASQAERILEDIRVQRWLGGLVQLWPHFPGGVSFCKGRRRLTLELEGARGDDPVRDKRLAVAIAAVLQANSAGKLVRIVAADPEFEARLTNPPIVVPSAKPRPSDFPDQSRVVSGVAPRKGGVVTTVLSVLLGIAVAAFMLTLFMGVDEMGPSPSGDGSGGLSNNAPGLAITVVLFGGLIALLVIAMVVRAFTQRKQQHQPPTPPNYWFSLAVTALWVTIVLASTNLRDEEVLWLVLGAIASVFLLPRLPAVFGGLRTMLLMFAIPTIVSIVVAVFWFFAAGVSVEAPAGVSYATPLEDMPMLHIANLKGPLHTRFGLELLEDKKVVRYVDRMVPGAGVAFTGAYSVDIRDHRMRVGQLGWSRLSAQQRAQVATVLSFVARQRAPKYVERAQVGPEWLESRMLKDRFATRVWDSHDEGYSIRFAQLRAASGPELASFQNRADFRAWLAATLPFSRGLFDGPLPVIKNSGRSLYVSFPTEWVDASRDHYWNGSSSWEQVVEAERRAIAAAYGMALETLHPKLALRTAPAPEDWVRRLDSNPFVPRNDE
ncbi:MAG: serine/threonine-protein kinase [Planctomycetota bacterium]